MFLRLPTGFLPTEDQGAAQVQFRLPPGATQNRTQEVQRKSKAISRSTKPRMSKPCSPSPAAAAAAAQRPEHRPGLHQFRRLEQAARQGQYRRRHRAARVERVPRPSRCAGVRAGARRDPWPRPVERLHHGAAEPQRHEPRAIHRPRATSCSISPMPTRKLTGVRIGDLPDVATLEGRCRSAEADGDGAQPERREQHALDRLGRPLRQRFHRPGARQARLCPG